MCRNWTLMTRRSMFAGPTKYFSLYHNNVLLSRRLHSVIPSLASSFSEPLRGDGTKSWHRLRIPSTELSFCQQTMLSTTSKSETVEGGGSEEVLGELEFDTEFSEFGGDIVTEELNQHVITNLYPYSNDSMLSEIMSANSIEQILNAWESVSDDRRTPEHSSQALVSLWDTQKILFQIGHLLDPDRDLANKHIFTEKLSKHPTFQKIVRHVTENVKFLEDEPIAACLLCLEKLEFSITSQPLQLLIEECLNRKETLQLPALSRFCVVMKTGGLYGKLVVTEFFPRLSELIQDMNNNQELRLISISLRSVNRLTSQAMVQLYCRRLNTLLNSGQLNQDAEGPLLCKILLCLIDIKWVLRESEENASIQSLQRRIGHLLTPKVKDLSLSDILSFHRFLEYNVQEPSGLNDALNNRVLRLIEEQEDTPRVDLMSCISPSTRQTVEQRQRLSTYIHPYLDSYSRFDQIYQLLFKLLKVVKVIDGSLCQKFWEKATQLISVESNDPRKVLKLCNDYLNFNFGMCYNFRHIQFETTAKSLLYFYIYNYEKNQQPTFIAPSDISKAYGFLIAFGWHSEPIFQETTHGLLNIFQKKFAPQSLPIAMYVVARGISTSLNYQGNNPRSPPKYFDQVMNFSSVVEDVVKKKLQENQDLQSNELILLTKIQFILRKASSESTLFKSTVSALAKSTKPHNFDSKEGRDIALVLLMTNYHEPVVLSLFQNFIRANPESISYEFVEKFLSYAYHFGLEAQTPEESTVFHICYDVLERHWESLGTLGLIQASLGLCFIQSLQPPLAHNIFSVEFLNRLDEEIKFSTLNSNFPYKIRKAYMELNRAVCLDLPSANVPWFHQKYCESIYSSFSVLPESSIEAEVNSSLTEILNDSTAIQANVYTPYFYFLNFLIEFDKSGKPIKKMKPRRLLSLHNLRSLKETVEVGARVGIFILPSSAYTTNVRSLKGYYVLRKRHMEMLGYRVIQIDPSHWNSMYMSEPLAKIDYLESAIFDKKGIINNQSVLELNLV